MTSHRRRHQRSAYWTRRYKWQQFNIWMKHTYVQNIADMLFSESPLIMRVNRMTRQQAIAKYGRKA